MLASRSVRSGSSDVSRMGLRSPVSRTPSSKFSRISICRYPYCRGARRYSTETVQSSLASCRMARPADSFSQVGTTSPYLLSFTPNSLLSFCPTRPTAKTTCSVCSRSIQETPDSLVILYLCRHVVHATCLSGSDRLPPRPDPVLRSAGLLGSAREINGKIA